MTAMVLVVDDSPIIQAALRDMLGVADYRVLCVSTAADALAALAGMRPDVVLLDMMLPGQDGLSALREIARLPDPPPVILMSAYPSAAGGVLTLEQVRPFGAQAFLAKPFELDTLLSTVAHALEPEA